MGSRCEFRTGSSPKCLPADGCGPATLNDDGLAHAEAASPFRLSRPRDRLTPQPFECCKIADSWCRSPAVGARRGRSPFQIRRLDEGVLTIAGGERKNPDARLSSVRKLLRSITRPGRRAGHPGLVRGALAT